MFDWVHSPVIVQLVLPVQTATGPVWSDTTRNLLCAKWLDETSRSCTSTFLPRRAVRAALFSSGWSAPLARTTCARGPKACSASISCGSSSSNSAAWISPPDASASLSSRGSCQRTDPPRKLLIRSPGVLMAWVSAGRAGPPRSRSARDSHCVATTPRLKKALMPSPTSGPTVTGSLQPVAFAGSSVRWSLSPVSGTAW